jgi:hypothetical protein
MEPKDSSHARWDSFRRLKSLVLKADYTGQLLANHRHKPAPVRPSFELRASG